MSRTLTLQVPDDVYESLERLAQQNGKPPEDIAIETLSESVRLRADDPIEKFIGAFSSDVTDWAENHDKHIGQSLMDEMRGDNSRKS